jgi:uncharacterized membrane protein SpoIIM required for sporulation
MATAEHFVRTHRAAWQRLDELVSKAEKGRLPSLSDDELHELGVLYRRACADLARAQTRLSTTHAGRELVRSLNALVLRSHALLYSAPAPQGARALEWAAWGFPAAFRRNWKPIALAAFLLFAPGLLAWACVLIDPSLAPLFVPEEAVEQVRQRAREKSTAGWGANNNYEGLVSSPAVSSFVMTNNIQVSIFALALGLTAGIGTAIVLVRNGLLVGALAGAATNERIDALFWSVILPHGVLELTAISIAGGAGLLLARAIWAPGDLPRSDALRLAGIEAAQLLVGVAIFLVIAGLIEGYLTPVPIAAEAKLLFAALTGVAMVAYLSLRRKTGLPAR